MMMKSLTTLAALALAVALAPASARGGEDVLAKAQAAQAKAVQYLVQNANEDGTFGKSQLRAVPGIVALALYGLASVPGKPEPAVQAVMDRAAAYLVKCQMENGAIGIPAFGNENYNTSVAVMALKALKNPKYDDVLAKAGKFIAGCQLTENRGYSKEEHVQAYGGFGYGKSMRPDLSNTAFAVEALKELGYGPDSPEMKNALTFVRRCQDNAETNDVPAMKDGDSTGAFQYLPGAEEACSEFGTVKTRSGKTLPKPYGNMTYQGIKSLIYCGLAKDSPELQAAWRWIKANYSVKEQPNGRGGEGYYYYVVAFAKAFTAAGKTMASFEDAEGRKVSWAEDLAVHLPLLQKSDGSFANETPRWMESDPVLSTSYGLVALNLCVEALKR